MSLARNRTVALAVLLTCLARVSVGADVQDLLGRTIVDVRVEVGGAPSQDPSLRQMIETHVGEPLSMERVRESIDHLVGLGRFEDIQVFAEPVGSRVDAVSVRWTLVPVQRIVQIEIDGAKVFSSSVLRSEITERLGVSPVSSRVGEIVRAVTSYYAGHGYRRAVIDAQLTPGRTPEQVTLRLVIMAGPRTSIRQVTVHGEADRPQVNLLDELNLQRGRAYDASAIDARLTALANQLREDGYYEARVQITPSFVDDESVVDLVVEVERGPRVRVVFAGDPLPENRRDALVPIRQERSIDLDLLEDASRNIEAFLRQQGYRAAEARYIREATGSEMVLTFTVNRGPVHRLASMAVVGNEAVAGADLAPLLDVRPGDPFSDGQVAAIAATVAELYRVRGFAAVAVKPEVSVLAGRSQDGEQVRPVAVRLLVAEGRQSVVGAVTIAGAVKLADARISPLLTLSTGRPFYRPRLDADRDAIERLYRNDGFQTVRVEPRTAVFDDGARVDVQWTIVEGPQVIVDRVLISGNERTSADTIRREVVLQPGTPLGDDAVVESQRRLAALGLFRRVRIIELPHGASTARDILIDVEEAPPTTIGYGGGVEAGRRLRRGEDLRAEERIDIAPRGFFEVSRRNLWGKNRSISFFTRVTLHPRDQDVEVGDETVTSGYGFNEYRMVGTFREPRLFDTPADIQFMGFVEQAIRSSFNFRRRGVRVEYARRLASKTVVSGRYSFERTRLFDRGILPEDEVNIDRLFPQVRLSTVTGAALRDTRNDPVDPVGGTLLGTDLSLALRALGSEVGFAKSFTQGFIYRRLPGAPFTIVAGARLGVAVGFERVIDDFIVDDIPASERFFAGGDTTVRGFVLDRLGTPGTMNALGYPTGGNGLVVVNAELRTPYWQGMSAVGFVDAGNVFRRAGDIDLAELRPAAGFGLRYRSPLGPLRVDFGFNPDPRPLPTGEIERRMVFHLSFGQAF